MKRKALYLGLFLALALFLLPGTALAAGDCAVSDVTAGTDRITAEVSTNKDSILVVALYDADGKMLGAETKDVSAGTGTVEVLLDADQQKAESAKLFLVSGEGHAPLCRAKVKYLVMANAQDVTGVLTSFAYDRSTGKWEYSVDDGSGLVSCTSPDDMTDLLGMTVTMTYDGRNADKDAYEIKGSGSQVLFSGLIGDLPNLANSATSIQFGGAAYRFDSGDLTTLDAFYFQNGSPYTFGADTMAELAGKYVGAATPGCTTVPSGTAYAAGDDITAYDAYEFSAIDNDGDRKIDNFMIYPFAAAKVTYCVGGDIRVTPSGATAYSVVSKQLPQPTYDALDANSIFNTFGLDYTQKLTIGVDVTAYDGIAKGDYVKFVPAKFTKDNTAVATRADLFSGKVTEDDVPDFTVNDVTYTTDVSYGYENTPRAGSTVVNAAAVNGYVFDIQSVIRSPVEEFAVVVGLSGNSGVEPQAKLLFSDGTRKVVSTERDYTAEIDIYKGALLAPGDLVIFRINSDGEYKLHSAPNTWADAASDLFGSFNYNGTAQAGKISNSSDKVGYVSGQVSNFYWGNIVNGRVTADTVVFLACDGRAVDPSDGMQVYKNPMNGQYYKDSWYGTPFYGSVSYDYNYKRITGDQLRQMDIAEIDNTFANAYALGTKNASGGYDLTLVYLSIGENSVLPSDTYFGYVTSVKEAQNADGDIVQQVKLWTEDGELTVLTVDCYDFPFTLGRNYIAKRDVIEYKLNFDGELCEVVAAYIADGETCTPAAAARSGCATAGITSWGSIVRFQALAAGQTYTDGAAVTTASACVTNAYFQPDGDTVYLYIDNEECAGASAADIKPAYGSAAAGAPAGALVPNALLVWDDEGTLRLVVYDVNNDIGQDPSPTLAPSNPGGAPKAVPCAVAVTLESSRAKLLFSDGTSVFVTTASDYTGLFRSGDLVSYEVGSDGKYLLKDLPASVNAANDQNYDLYGDSSSPDLVQVMKASNTSDRAGFITGADKDGTVIPAGITSDTVAFVRYYDGMEAKYKKLSGDELKKLDAADFDNTFDGRYMLGVKESGGHGNYDVSLAYLSTKTGVGLHTSSSGFAYVEKVASVENPYGDVVQQVTLWTENGRQTLLTMADAGFTISKYTAIQYRLNSDGEICDVLMQAAVDEAPLVSAGAGTKGYATAGITKWETIMEFQQLAAGQPYTDGATVTTASAGVTNPYFEPESDTVYLYIDSEDHTGADPTSIQTADDSDAPGAPAGALTPNAFLVWDDEGSLKLVVYDVNNDITG